MLQPNSYGSGRYWLRQARQLPQALLSRALPSRHARNFGVKLVYEEKSGPVKLISKIKVIPLNWHDGGSNLGIGECDVQNIKVFTCVFTGKMFSLPSDQNFAKKSLFKNLGNLGHLINACSMPLHSSINHWLRQLGGTTLHIYSVKMFAV